MINLEKSVHNLWEPLPRNQYTRRSYNFREQRLLHYVYYRALQLHPDFTVGIPAKWKVKR